MRRIHLVLPSGSKQAGIKCWINPSSKEDSLSAANDTYSTTTQ